MSEGIVQRYPLVPCSVMFGAPDEEHLEALTIQHLLTAHGWPTLIDVLRDGCQFDCDHCHDGDEG